MVERLDSAEAAELVAQAFAPGTLVHGLSDELWLANTLSSGIKPTTCNGLIKLSICTAMLPNIRLEIHGKVIFKPGILVQETNLKAI